MKKRISIAVMFAALFAGGCTHEELFARLANFPDHVQVFTVENGDWANGFIGFRFIDNPLSSLLVQ